MPRPGPKSFECIRRAWHSDRHQPMRGSLIQEIFRVVNEIHSSATKKNKEWQEKLPIVVLKAEEIMYSKANSEAEYMDIKTLWDRTNDAINTIIRREESTETGELLQPCIEAALILGCTARRASRSQRNNNPRCYLNPSAQEPTLVSPRAPDNVTHGGSSHLLPIHSENPTSTPRFMPPYSTTGRPTAITTAQSRSESCTPATNNTNPTMSHGFPFKMDTFPNHIFARENHQATSVGRSYSLYFGMGAPRQTTDSDHIFRPPQGSTSNTAVLATSQVQLVGEPTDKGLLENQPTWEGDVIASNRNKTTDLMGKIEYTPTVNCDLSLRLGPFSATCPSAETRCIREVEDVDASSSQERRKSCDPLQGTSKEFCFFPKDNAGNPLETSQWSSRDGLNLEERNRKRKAPASSLVEGEHFPQRQNFGYDVYFGRMNNQDN